MAQYQNVRKIVSSAIAAALLLGGVQRPVEACTGIRLTAEDGTAVHARTLEFAIDLHSDVIMVPRGFARAGTTPDGRVPAPPKSLSFPPNPTFTIPILELHSYFLYYILDFT